MPPGAGPEPYPEHAYYDDDVDQVVYRSPPFREAQLPVEEGLETETSPSPLPVRPRVLEDDEYGGDGEGDAFAGFATFR